MKGIIRSLLPVWVTVNSLSLCTGNIVGLTWYINSELRWTLFFVVPGLELRAYSLSHPTSDPTDLCLLSS
jgi:hypothetical protein